MNNMKKVVIDFINNHWNEVVNLRSDDYFTKKEILKIVKVDRIYLEWVFGEIMYWGCVIDYLSPFIVLDCDEEGSRVYKIKNTYYKHNVETTFLDKVKPKYRKVLYFD